MVEQYEEYKCKTIDLYLRLKGMALCIDNSRYDIDECHQDRKDINGKAPYHEGSVFLA